MYIPLLLFDISIWSLSPNFLWRYINIWHLFAPAPARVPWSCGVAVALLCDNSAIDPDYAYYQWGSAPQGEQGHRGWGWKWGPPSKIPLEGGSGTHHGCKHGFIYKWQWTRNMTLLANFELLVVIDCWKIRKWAKSRPGGNKAGCWILYFRPDLFRYSLC